MSDTDETAEMEQRRQAAAILAARLARYRDNVMSENIDGIVYTSSKIPTGPALRLFGRVAVVLGESGLRLIATHTMMLRSLFSGDPRMFAAIVQIMEGLNADPTLPIDLLIASGVKCNALRPGNKAGDLDAKSFDLHFMGELPHLLAVLQFVLAHNFAGFSLGSLLTSGSHTNDTTSTDAQSG